MKRETKILRLEKLISKLEVKLNKTLEKVQNKKGLLQNLNDTLAQFYKKQIVKANLKLEAINNNSYVDKNKIFVYASDIQKQKGKRFHEKLISKSLDRKEKTTIKYHEYIKTRREKGKKANKKVFRLGQKINHYEMVIKYHETELLKIDNGVYVYKNVYERIKQKFRQIPYETQKKIWGIIFISPWLVGVIFFFLFPLFKTIWYSFNVTKPYNGKITTVFDGFGQYKYLFTTYTYYGALYLEELLNSMLDVVINVPVILIFSLFIAVLLSKDFKGSKFIKVLFFIPVVYNVTVITQITDGQMGDRLNSDLTVIADTFTSFLVQMGLGQGIISFLIQTVDRIQSIINLSGVQILIFLAALQSIPKNLYEAADMEGCTGYEKFWKITFPMVTPIFLTCVVYTIVDNFTRSSILTMVDNARDSLQNYGLASAMSVLYFLFNAVVIVVSFLALKGVVFYYDDRK